MLPIILLAWIHSQVNILSFKEKSDSNFFHSLVYYLSSLFLWLSYLRSSNNVLLSAILLGVE